MHLAEKILLLQPTKFGGDYQAARVRFEQEFTFDRMAARTFDVYARLLNERERKGAKGRHLRLGPSLPVGVAVEPVAYVVGIGAAPAFIAGADAPAFPLVPALEREDIGVGRSGGRKGTSPAEG